MLILYGADLSSPSNKVRFVANALALPYEYKKVAVRKGENRTPEFLKLNPVGKIPVIDDHGFVLFESNAIIKYLAQKNNSSLYPLALEQKSLIDQWMDFISIHIGGAMDKVLYNRVFAPMRGDVSDEKALSDGENLFHRFLPVVDNFLNLKEYLFGMPLTLADMALLATLDPTEVAGLDLAKYPNVKAWREKMQAKDFYTRCHKSYSDSLNNFKKQT